MKRNRKLPGSYSDEEMVQVEEQARRARLEPAVYMRVLLKLAPVQIGRPPKRQRDRNGAKANK
jgi:hypothetical protein